MKRYYDLVADALTRVKEIMPWDLDLTCAHNMYRSDPGGCGVDWLGDRILAPIKESGTGAQSGTGVIRLSGVRPAFDLEFRNRLREIRDLLVNTNQAFKLLDEYAGLLRGPATGPTILDADRAQWDYNPKMADSAYSSSIGKAGQGRFYQFPSVGYRQDPGVVLAALGVCSGAAMLGAIGAMRRVLRLPPAEAMRPDTPGAFRAGLAERLGVQRHLSAAQRIILRNIERRPLRAMLATAGMARAQPFLLLRDFRPFPR